MMKDEKSLKILETFAEELDYNRVAVHIVDYISETFDTLEDAVDYLRDVVRYGCISGVVTELIYTHQQMKFFDKYFDDINELYYDYIDNVGEAPELNGSLLNVTWFAYEMSAQLVLDKLEYFEWMND